MEASGPQQDRNIQNVESNLALIASGLFTFRFERLHTCSVCQSLEEKNLLPESQNDPATVLQMEINRILN